MTNTDISVEEELEAAPDATARSSAPEVVDQNARRHEKKLLQCVQRVLRTDGQNFSEAAIRDLPDLSEQAFGPRDAVSALSNCGFVASGGEIKAGEITSGHCPLIAFDKDGSPFLILDVTERGMLSIGDPDTDFAEKKVAVDAFAEDFSNFVILAKRRPEVKANAPKKNWFWGSLKQSKWLYVQVVVAAAVSNFLGLSTALFIMVVYDRVVPNEAVESLIALTIGVLLALGFDFLIKSLRGNFVDKAGKRADIRMSRLIFDKILVMNLEKRSKKSGALASIVREFETLRDFFTSATLVTVVDLPFIFFFIWVISIIAGPLALVPLVAVPVVLVIGLVIQPFLARITAGSTSAKHDTSQRAAKKTSNARSASSVP